MVTVGEEDWNGSNRDNSFVLITCDQWANVRPLKPYTDGRLGSMDDLYGQARN